MAHISTAVEYGLHCLLFLAEQEKDAAPPGVRELAELQGAPPEYLAKIFTRLKKAGIVVAIEGSKGGFRLGREPKAISVLEVVQAIDGKRDLFECREVRRKCALFDGKPPGWVTRGVCSIHAVMIEAEQKVLEIFASYTLADMAARVTTKAPKTFDRDVVVWLQNRTRSRGSRD